MKIEQTMPNQKSNLPVREYGPESMLRNPVKLIRELPRDLISSYDLAWRLLTRNISAQYRQSLLGYLWVFMPPIFTTLIWVYLSSQRIIQVSQTEIPYPAFVLVGTLLWQGFVDAINIPLKLVAGNKAMLAKINFPREALILAAFGEVAFNFIVRLLILLGVFAWFRLPVPGTIFLFPLGAFALLTLGLSTGILLIPFGMLYQDIQYGLLFVTQVWFFITPIVYTPPTQWPASLLTQLNPVSPLIITTREWITTGDTVRLESFLLVTGLSLILFFFGWVFFRLSMPHLIVRMSA